MLNQPLKNIVLVSIMLGIKPDPIRIDKLTVEGDNHEYVI
jgi:hypothetical protein